MYVGRKHVNHIKWKCQEEEENDYWHTRGRVNEVKRGGRGKRRLEWVDIKKNGRVGRLRLPQKNVLKEKTEIIEETEVNKDIERKPMKGLISSGKKRERERERERENASIYQQWSTKLF